MPTVSGVISSRPPMETFIIRYATMAKSPATPSLLLRPMAHANREDDRQIAEDDAAACLKYTEYAMYRRRIHRGHHLPKARACDTTSSGSRIPAAVRIAMGVWREPPMFVILLTHSMKMFFTKDFTLSCCLIEISHMQAGTPRGGVTAFCNSGERCCRLCSYTYYYRIA